MPATRAGLGRWLAQLPGHPGAFAVEACTGWRFVVEELQAAGWQAYLAEPAETAALRGPKRRAKTDRTDAQLLRELLEQGRLPQAWIPPAHLLALRVLVRLGKTLVDERTAWQQRLHAVLFHHGLPCPDHALLTQATRGWPQQVTLPQAAAAGHDRAGPDRPAGPGAGAVGALAARLRPPPTRLPGADRPPLWDRDADRPDHPGRAGRRPPFRQRRRGRAPHRPGRDRAQLRQQAPPRPPVPPRPAGAGLGVV
jgi:Transposase